MGNEGPIERGDIRNENDLDGAFETWRPWALMHFAAIETLSRDSLIQGGFRGITAGVGFFKNIQRVPYDDIGM